MSEPLFALTRNGVAAYLGTLITVYTVLIVARIILSYFTRIPYNRALSAVIGFVSDVTDPYLNLFRRFIPPIRAGAVSLDVSPIVALLVLQIFGGILVSLVASG